MKKILVISSIVILFLGLFLFQFFVQVKVSCKSQYGDCPEEIVKALLPINGKKLFAAKKELKKVFKANLLVSKYSFQFKLPNTLNVDLIVRKPLFALKNSVSNMLGLIDADGNVLSMASGSALPTLIVNEDLPKVGQRIEPNNLFALMLLDGLYKMYQIGNGFKENDTLLVDLPGPVRVIFPLVDGDSQLLLGSLRLIYSNIQNNDNGVIYKEIDMRYKNPVLR